MPELPEVETIRNNLREGTIDVPPILGLELRGALVLWDRTLEKPSKVEFLAHLPGQQIIEIERRGKYFIFRLSQNYLLIHLRMSGDLLLEKQPAPLAKTCRLALFLEDEWRLSFNDARKFGRVWLVNDPAEVVGNLGPEPLDPEFRAQDLYQALHSRTRQLKPLLLDQQFLAGLGNIYTDEALHLAKIHPLTLSNQLNQVQVEHLWRSIRQVLQDGIHHSGASIDWVYRGGDHQNFFRVYDRKGKPCRGCGALIQRIVIGQRGTYFCPVCQPEISNAEEKAGAEPGG
jgi:formamidopyrimidine-DNA glycosylase